MCDYSEFYGECLPDPIDNGYMYVENYDHAVDHLQGVYNALYKSGSVEDLEFSLEELFHVFDLKFDNVEPKLKKNNRFEWHAGYSQAMKDLNLKTNRTAESYKIGG